MLFNSYEFIFFFLPITLLLFYACCYSGQVRLAIWLVGLASLFFYAYWDVRFLALFACSIIVNYLIGSRIIGYGASANLSAHARVLRTYRKKKIWLMVGLLFNLMLLFFFKYTHFLMQSLCMITGLKLRLIEIILPIGISFFTFTQIAYLVDCMRHLRKQYIFSDYLLFVSFFPHLVAGPILRHDKLIPQLKNKGFGRPSARKVYIAILFFSLGLFKKVIIADNLAEYVDPLFNNAMHLNVLNAWAAALLYTFQIYFDFSAYSEMAIGLALLMNIKIPLNFNSPYKARSLVDFWRRWHISLSEFLRDYLYIPLGGKRKGDLRRYLNLLTTMLLGGLWHGAAWTFLIWGGIHGICLTLNHAWRRVGIALPGSLSWLLTFLTIVISWIFFRAHNLSSALSMLKSLVGFTDYSVDTYQVPIFTFFVIIVLIGWTLSVPNTRQMAIKLHTNKMMAIVATILLFIGILGLGNSEHFIYFQF